MEVSVSMASIRDRGSLFELPSDYGLFLHFSAFLLIRCLSIGNQDTRRVFAKSATFEIGEQGKLLRAALRRAFAQN